MADQEKLWFWRRNFAVVIDFLATSLMFVLVFTLVTGGTSDMLRLKGFGITARSCEPAKLSPNVLAAGNNMVPGVIWTVAAQCNIRSFGLTDNRMIVLARSDQQPNKITVTRSVEVPIDTTGNPVSPIHLDFLGILLLLVASVIFLTSRLGATPGMKLMRLRLVTTTGERAGLKIIFLHLLYTCTPMVAVVILIVGTFWLMATYNLSAWLLAPAIFCSLFVGLSWWRPFELHRGLPRAPLHDILAGTRIVRS